MSSAGAQAVARSLPCGWPCRPSAWASIGLIWAISSCALRRSWNGSHRVMVAIWSPFVHGPCGPAARGGRRPVADRRSLAEELCSQYPERCSPVKVSVHRGNWGRGGRPHPRKPVTPASGDYRYRQELALAVFTHPATTRTTAAPKLTLPPGGGRGAGRFSPTAVASSAQLPAWTSVTELGLG